MEDQRDARRLQSPSWLSSRWRQNFPGHHLGRNQEFLQGHARRRGQRPLDCLRDDPSRRLRRFQGHPRDGPLERFHRILSFERRAGKRRASGYPRKPYRPPRRRRHEQRSSHLGRAISLEDYGAEVLRTGRRCHLVITDDRLVGMMNVHTLNSVPRNEWAHNSVQAVMIPRERILWATPDEPLLALLERLLSADINQIPIVSGSDDGAAQIIGMVSRDSILRVMQTRSELGPLSVGAASK